MIELGKQSFRKVLRIIRTQNNKNLFWWQGPPYNAGDWVGPFLYKAITSNEPHFRKASNKSLSTVYLTVGSLARWFCEDSIVWGSGIIERNEDFWQPYQTLAVRGPHTRDRFLELGYSCPEIYGDPAILMPKFYKPEQAVEYKLGIIPHYSNFDQAIEYYGKDEDTLVIDIKLPLKEVIKKILSCKSIVSSSLHGLIFAHSYKIPAGYIEFTSKPGGDGVKFMDYYASGKIMSVPEALILNNKVPVIELEQHAISSPMPDLDPLLDPLLAACPFK